jgi:hypothetical protein
MEIPFNKRCDSRLRYRSRIWPDLVILSGLLFVLVFFFPDPSNTAPRPDPAKIPEILALKGKNLTALKASMSVSTEHNGGKSRQEVQGFLLYRRPTDFRFQGRGPGGNTLFEMVVKWNTFELYVPTERKILKGNRRCFKERFPDVAELDTLIPLVLLQWRQAKFLEPVSREGGRTVLLVSFKGVKWRATLDSSTLFLLRMERLGPGGVDLTADFGDFGSAEYKWLPKRFDVRSQKDGWRTNIVIRKFEINPFLVENNFKLEPTFSTEVENCK